MTAEEHAHTRAEHRREFCQKYCPRHASGLCEEHKETLRRLEDVEDEAFLARVLRKPVISVVVLVITSVFGTLGAIYWKVADTQHTIIKVNERLTAVEGVLNSHREDAKDTASKLDDHLNRGAFQLHKELHQNKGE